MFIYSTLSSPHFKSGICQITATLLVTDKSAQNYEEMDLFSLEQKCSLLFPCLEKVIRKEIIIDYFPCVLLLGENRNCLY